MRWAARLLLIPAIAIAATAAHCGDVDYPPGSRLGMIPPSGMVVSKNFVGYEDLNHNAAIILASLPPDAYSELDKSVTAEALRRQGVKLDRREPLSLASGKAFLVTARQEVDKTKFRKWILIGSAPGLTALVTVQIPETATAAYPESTIRTALGTLAIRPSVPTEEQLGLLPFRVGEFAGFQVDGVAPGRAVVLKDPPSFPFTPGQPQSHIFVTAAPGGPSHTTERDGFARDVFASVPNVRDVRVISSEPLRIVGQPGHQIMAQARDPSGSMSLTIVQWLRFGGGGYLQLVGIAPTQAWPEAYPRFRQVRDNIEPR
jgi:hypothetical protein